MPSTRLEYLFRKYFDKTATPEEAAEFMRLADKDEHAAEIRALMEESWAGFEQAPPVFGAGQSEAMLRAVLGPPGAQEAESRQETMPVRRVPWRSIAAAAVLIGALGSGVWWWAHTVKPGPAPLAVVEHKPVKATVAAGGNKAVLILDNGSTVTLDSARTGVLTTQGNTRVIKLDGGRLAYAGEGTASNAVLYNTVRTPRGGQYQVALPDGSKVWLNAATTLRFPTAFSGKDRTVELAGEAYFEVAANKNQPFRVKVDDMKIDVLGTHFNVMAYDDEGSFHTTLLTGAVRVEEGTEARLLKPGEEARMSLDTKNLTIAVADTDQVVAWKNGLFQFDGATLETVLRQVARWYDVDVRYEGTIPKHFSGLISRGASLAEVLHVLDKTGKTRFVLEGRTVVVRPK
jgi:transmembrane sensor